MTAENSENSGEANRAELRTALAEWIMAKVITVEAEHATVQASDDTSTIGQHKKGLELAKLDGKFELLNELRLDLSSYFEGDTN